jgi:hypothetical protein
VANRASNFPADVKNLSHEIEFMSGFEIVEDQVQVSRELMGEVIEDKRRRERSRFRLAENAMVIKEFIERYTRVAKRVYGVISIVSGMVRAKEEDV